MSPINPRLLPATPPLQPPAPVPALGAPLPPRRLSTSHAAAFPTCAYVYVYVYVHVYVYVYVYVHVHVHVHVQNTIIYGTGGILVFLYIIYRRTH